MTYSHNKLALFAFALWLAPLTLQALLHQDNASGEPEKAASVLPTAHRATSPSARMPFDHNTAIPLSEQRSDLAPKRNAIQAKALSLVVLPLDFLKQASLCVLKAPLLFLAATSAFASGAHAELTTHSVIQAPPPDYRASLDLSAYWDTQLCAGRALTPHQIQGFNDQHYRCQQSACSSHVASSIACNYPKARFRLKLKGELEDACDDVTCSPRSIRPQLAQHAQQGIDDCVRQACHTSGRPYTGRFSCTAFAKEVSTRQQIDRAILGADKCFENFCQAHAHKTCPQQAAWWQRLFGISLCNDTLCTHRFVLKEDNGVDLENQGEQSMQECKELPAYKDHCL
ncbi:MAG: hypothetical protein ACPG7U_04385 [Holosporaceae bacterium]